MRNSFTLISLLLFLLSSMSQAYANEYQLLVSKKNNELIVEKAGQVIKKYHIASGKGGKGTKRLRGDSKTPLGAYHVASFKENSRFHFFIQLDYPNLLDAWYGYKNKIIDAGNFKRIAAAYKKREAPPQDTELGGFIGIHGLGITNDEKLTIHESFNWTEGCIALTNEEINDLRKFVAIGTPVIIKE
jgi:murein L,D-transpeptidase YafK